MTTGWQLLIGWAAFVMLSAIVLAIWGYASGQFRNIERPKYRMLEDREPEPWPDRRTRRRKQSGEGSGDLGRRE